MGLSEHYQEQRDLLLEHLELTTVEKRFVELCWRNDLAARRVAHLVSEYVESELSTERESLLRILVEEAVPRLRLAISAASLTTPDGYTLVSEQQVRALRSVVDMSAHVVAAQGAERAKFIFNLADRLEVVQNLDQLSA